MLLAKEGRVDIGSAGKDIFDRAAPEARSARGAVNVELAEQRRTQNRAPRLHGAETAAIDGRFVRRPAALDIELAGSKDRGKAGAAARGDDQAAAGIDTRVEGAAEDEFLGAVASERRAEIAAAGKHRLGAGAAGDAAADYRAVPGGAGEDHEFAAAYRGRVRGSGHV